MGETAIFRSEDRVAIPVAIVLHLAVMALLLFQPSRGDVLDIPERMTVSLASEVSLEATAPNPAEDSRAAMAPELSDEPAPVSEADVTESIPEATTPPTQRRTTTSPTSPERNSPTTPTRQPDPPARNAERGGGSRIGEDFLPGSGSSTTTDDTRIPASQIGASAKASIIQAIVRQIRPHWNAPSGVDAELLVTELAFDLNEDGSLKGRPRVLRQSGETDANRPQKALHAERAIRAVQLAAPFDLPDEYYNAWKSIRGARFDRNLSR
ncbi:energy transducer TonB [Erythrobacter sp. GH1-10]|uniref:energy transducer TonB n=1 Tax=Erythrobacter sp. GH1-10 TaxID=3349334 RepID=UPI0038782344